MYKLHLMHIIKAGVTWNKLIIRQLVVITLSNLQGEKRLYNTETFSRQT